MKLELISFKLCPFVQRAVIALKYFKIPYDITYIDIMNPPAWFVEISPLEKVPVLRVDDQINLFESAVIAEFIDDIAPGSLLPSDPLPRAFNRSWTELGSACLGDQYQMTGAEDEAAYQRARAALIDKLELFEETMTGPFFNGDQPALIDFATAPLFLRLDILSAANGLIDPATMPKVAAWSAALLAMDEVKHSVVPEFTGMYRAMVCKRSRLCAEKHGLN